MKKVKLLNDSEMSKVVGGSLKSGAVKTGAVITCASGALGLVSFIAAMISEDHKELLYKTSAAFGAIMVTGLASTAAISKICEW